MAKEYVLYTVRGMREVYYAAVDWESGKVWTSPTKDAANRMAREAGFDVYKEEVISKDELMRSMGFGRTLKLRASEAEKPKTALFTDHEPESKEPKPPADSPASWFVPAAGQVELGAAERFPPTPRMSKSSKKSRKGANKGNPFAAGGLLVSGPVGDPEGTDDVLIVPSSDTPAAEKATFSDEAPPIGPDDGKDF